MLLQARVSACLRPLAAPRGGRTRVMASASPPPAALLSSAYASELVAALVAVHSAAQLTSGAQGALISGTDTAAKADASPVTVADYAAQALISASLGNACPSIPLLAEEDAQQLRTPSGSAQLTRVAALLNAQRATEALPPLAAAEVLSAIDRGGSEVTQERLWVLDPIDGTRGFVAGRQYAVALGLMHRGEVVLGVVGCPNLGTRGVGVCAPGEGVVFFAVRGYGSFQAPLRLFAGVDGESAASAVTRAFASPEVHRLAIDAARPLAALRYVESAPDSVCAAHGDTARVAAALGLLNAPERLDSCAKYGVLARGEAELYLRFPPVGYAEKIWDHAAGGILVEEAGFIVSDCAGQPLDYSKGRTFTSMKGGIVAAPPAAHEALLAAVAQRVHR